MNVREHQKNKILLPEHNENNYARSKIRANGALTEGAVNDQAI
jgi:hypothetical protein